MNWLQELLDHAKALGRDVWEHDAGVGIDFEDGCDAFWILPGEITSTIPVPAEGPASVEALLARYSEINRLRERALHVVRHYLASNRVCVDRSRDGDWGVELEDGCTSAINVGMHLTAVARDSSDVYQVVRSAFEHSWIRKAPSPRRIDRYLNTPGPPPNERSIRDVPEHRTQVPETIHGVLRWMGLCTGRRYPVLRKARGAWQSRGIAQGDAHCGKGARRQDRSCRRSATGS